MANKKQKRLVFRIIVLILLVAAVAFAFVSHFKKDTGIVEEGDQAPNFALSLVNGENSIQLSDLKGKGVMLNFWATYCKPCESEMPYMEQLYPAYKEKGVEIVAVSLDTTNLVIKQFIKDHGLTFPVLHDKRGEVMDLYKIGPIPTTFFIDPQGKVIKKIEGPLTLDKLDGYLTQIEPK